MKAHELNEGETILVTGTQDVEAARAYALAHDEWDWSDKVRESEGRAVQGCIVPINRASQAYLPYRWWWREGDGGNRVKAVVFE